MLHLITSDLYRITRPRGLRGSFWQYGIALAAVYAAVIALMFFARSQTYAALSGNAVIPSSFASPAAYFASMMSNIVPLCTCFMVVELALADFKQGFVKSVLSARQGRLSYFGAKILFAGVLTALVIALATVIIGICGVVGGFTFEAMDEPMALIAWFAGMWLNTWALAVASLILVYATRINPVSYIASFCLCMGAVSQLLFGLAYSSGGLLRFLAPIAPALETLAAWMPSTALSHLSMGSALFANATDLFGPSSQALTIDPGIQALATGIIWIVVAGGIVLAIACKRDV